MSTYVNPLGTGNFISLSAVRLGSAEDEKLER